MIRFNALTVTLVNYAIYNTVGPMPEVSLHKIVPRAIIV